jgi:hypothetical protein
MSLYTPPPQPREVPRSTYGPNSLDLGVPPLGWMLLREALRPFAIFQFLSILSWMLSVRWEMMMIMIMMVVWLPSFQCRHRHRNLMVATSSS